MFSCVYKRSHIDAAPTKIGHGTCTASLESKRFQRELFRNRESRLLSNHGNRRGPDRRFLRDHPSRGPSLRSPVRFCRLLESAATTVCRSCHPFAVEGFRRLAFAV